MFLTLSLGLPLFRSPRRLAFTTRLPASPVCGSVGADIKHIISCPDFICILTVLAATQVSICNKLFSMREGILTVSSLWKHFVVAFSSPETLVDMLAQFFLDMCHLLGLLDAIPEVFLVWAASFYVTQYTCTSLRVSMSARDGLEGVASAAI